MAGAGGYLMRRPAAMTEVELKRIFRAALKAGLWPRVKPDGSVEMLKSPTTTGAGTTEPEAEREIVL